MLYTFSSPEWSRKLPFSPCFITWGRMHSYNYCLGYNCCFRWKPRKPNPCCCWKCIISSLCSLTPLILLTHLAWGVPFLGPPISSPQLEMPQTARSTSCGRGFAFWGLRAEWTTCFKCSQIHGASFKTQEWVASGSVRHKRIPSFLFLFKKWICNGSLSRNTIIGQPGVR